MFHHTPDTILIPLQYGISTIVSVEDSDLSQYGWVLKFDPITFHIISVYRTRYTDAGRKRVAIHRLIMERVLGRSLGHSEIVDHKDTNPLNNQRDNLRITDKVGNSANSTIRRDSSSGYKGVSFDYTVSKWRARIGHESELIGYFDTPEEAFVAYSKQATILYGEFWNPGFVNPVVVEAESSLKINVEALDKIKFKPCAICGNTMHRGELSARKFHKRKFCSEQCATDSLNQYKRDKRAGKK